MLIIIYSLRRNIQKAFKSPHIKQDDFEYMLSTCRNLRDLFLNKNKNLNPEGLPYYLNTFSLEWLDETVLELEICNDDEINKSARELTGIIDNMVTDKGIGRKTIR